MKAVQTLISNNTTKNDYVKIKKEYVIDMDRDITTILNWIEELNEKPDSPVTEASYGAIDRLSSYLELYQKL